MLLLDWQNSLGMELGAENPELYRTAMALCVKNEVDDGLNRHRFEHGALSLGKLAVEQPALYDELYAYIKNGLK